LSNVPNIHQVFVTLLIRTVLETEGSPLHLVSHHMVDTAWWKPNRRWKK